MDLVAILVNLIVGGLFVYCLWILLNWITGMIAIPGPLKTVIMIIFAILVILWLVGALGVPRISFGNRASVTIR